jgi:hypothetical protein
MYPSKVNNQGADHFDLLFCQFEESGFLLDPLFPQHRKLKLGKTVAARYRIYFE